MSELYGDEFLFRDFRLNIFPKGLDGIRLTSHSTELAIARLLTSILKARRLIRALGRSNQIVVESIMDDYTAGELQEALVPIVSLISKSEKAQRRLAPGTWQHTMLRDNLKALRQALALINNETINANSFTRDDLREALHAFASMISKTEKALAGFSPGTSQYALQRNRLKALHIAETLIRLKLDGPNERA